MALLNSLRRAVIGFSARMLKPGSRSTSEPAKSEIAFLPRYEVPESSATATNGLLASGAFGFSELPGADVVGLMTADDLLAWENRDAPSVERVSDLSEARTDERSEERRVGKECRSRWSPY